MSGGKKLLKMRRGSGFNASFNRSFKLNRPEGGGSKIPIMKFSCILIKGQLFLVLRWEMDEM